MGNPVPFSALLDALRAKGLPVGVREHLAFARLLERFGSTNPAVLRDAIAALLAASPDEALLVRRTFDDLYAPTTETRRPTPPPPRLWRRAADARLVWAAGVVLLLLGAGGGWMAWLFSTPPPAPPPAIQAAPPRALPVPDLTDPASRAAEGPALPAPPPLPPAPQPRNWLMALVAAALAALAVLAVVQKPRADAAHRRWLERSWRQVRARMPGPSFFSGRAPLAPRWFDRAALDDAATLLGRAFTSGLQSERLDIDRTIELTVAGGMLPRLVFKPSAIAGILLVLEDTGVEMALWRDKTQAFVTALARQGLAVERWYFEDTPATVSAEPHGVPVAFDVLRRRRASGILVISSGAGLHRTFSSPSSDRTWIDSLATWARRSWLNPVIDAATWRREVDRLPLNVWPFDSDGILEAAADLVVDPELKDHRRRARRPASRPVLADDVERLERLIAIAGAPSMEVIEVLRQRYIPDAPEDTVLHVIGSADHALPDEVRLPPERVRRLVAAERAENPGRELAVRQYMAGVLNANRPAAGSLADARWRLAMARQQAALAELGVGSKAEASRALEELANGPLWAEARDVLAEVPGARLRKGDNARPPRRLPAAVGSTRRGWRWLRPQPMDLVLAGLVAAIVAGGLDRVGAFDGAAVLHRDRAYELAFNPADGLADTAGSLRVGYGADGAGVPAVIQLYRDGELFGAPLTIPPTGTADQPLAFADSGHYFQARASLPGGNLAVSNALAVPAVGRTASVTIDASPWATARLLDAVTRLPVTTTDFTTPFVVTLPPGAYLLELRHPDYGTTTETIEVGPGQPASRHFTMPGFDAQAAARAIFAK